MEYIAHLRMEDDAEGVGIQTTKEHSENVCALMQSYATGIGLNSFAALIGLLHDEEKLSENFCGYLRYSFLHPNDHSRKGSVDHSSAGAKLLLERYGRGDDVCQFTVELAAMLILSHHSGLINFIGEDGSSDYLRRMDKEILLDTAGTEYFFREVISEQKLDKLFAEACQEISMMNQHIIECCDAENATDDVKIKKYTFYWGMVEKLLFSMLVDADRLDTAKFMMGRKLERNWDEAELWQDFQIKLERKLTGFEMPINQKERRIAEARQQISEECLKAAAWNPGIYRLSVPTGSGKTLASMRFALEHAKRFKKKRILVVIPYTSIIDQNAGELREIFACDDAVLEHHSNVMPDESEENLDDYAEKAVWRRVLTERWDVPVIFTTQVQFLNTLFAGGCRSIRRLHALEDSVIIFDEIQTLPVRCTFLFNEAMNFLADFCGVTALLCTATQPTLGNVDIPLEMPSQPDLVSGLEDVFNAFRRVECEDIRCEGGYEVDEIASKILQDAEENGDVLCIVNLTVEARAIYQALKLCAEEEEQLIEIVHLSTKMCPAHRREVLEHIRGHLAAKRKKKISGSLICVSTQLIEAGVDVSFPVVYRALAGYPSIAQAAGRCNRHGELEYGIVKLFNLQGEKDKLGKLKDIEIGIKIAEEMLHHESAATILQPGQMQQYFEQYYGEQSGLVMSYPTRNNMASLFDLLSQNCVGTNIREEKGNSMLLSNRHAFRDAGKEFSVIDSQTTGILVSYGEGIKLVVWFDAMNFDKSDIQRKLRHAQQYMVNVFSHELTKLALNWEQFGKHRLVFLP